MTARPVVGPTPLVSGYSVEDFDCGVESLNNYLKKRAFADQTAEKSRTYVILRDGRVVGFFSVAAGSVAPDDATERAIKGQGNQDVPAILLGRLAVDVGEQKQGFGEALLMDAMRRSVTAADTIGARVILVHAIDEPARAFYVKYGFEPSLTHDLHLMMLMKDARISLLSA